MFAPCRGHRVHIHPLLVFFLVLLSGLFGACHRITIPTSPPLRIAPPAVKEVRLESGLRIIVFERPSSSGFAGLLACDVGSTAEPRGQSGIAHLVEHLMSKSTRALGAKRRSPTRPPNIAACTRPANARPSSSAPAASTGTPRPHTT